MDGMFKKHCAIRPVRFLVFNYTVPGFFSEYLCATLILFSNLFFSLLYLLSCLPNDNNDTWEGYQNNFIYSGVNYSEIA